MSAKKVLLKNNSDKKLELFNKQNETCKGKQQTIEANLFSFNHECGYILFYIITPVKSSIFSLSVLLFLRNTDKIFGHCYQIEIIVLIVFPYTLDFHSFSFGKRNKSWKLGCIFL